MPTLTPLGDCVVIGGGTGDRNRQTGSRALECGRFIFMGNGPCQ